VTERVGAEDVEAVVADVGGGAGDRVEQLLYGGTDAVLDGPAARRRPERLGGAGEVEQVRARSASSSCSARASASSTLSEAPARSPRSRRV
jgi:hypothetical protein